MSTGRCPRRQVAAELHRLLTALLSADEIRRQLPVDAPAAFRRLGVVAAAVPPRLHRPSRPVSVRLDGASLFSSAAPSEPADEIRLVAYGAKPAALVFGRLSQLAGWLAWAEQAGLVGVLSADAYLGTAGSGFQHVAHGSRPAAGAADEHRALVVAADVETAVLGWLALLFGWDALLGGILGYPACCTAFFEAAWPVACARYAGDAAQLSLEQSGSAPFDYRVNVFARYFGTRLIHHFPCRLECEASRGLAERAEAALLAHAPSQLPPLQARLRAPVLLTPEETVVARGGVVVAGQHLDVLRYRPERLAATHPGSPLTEALALAGSLTATRDGWLLVGDHRLPGRLLRFE